MKPNGCIVKQSGDSPVHKTGCISHLGTALSFPFAHDRLLKPPDATPYRTVARQAAMPVHFKTCKVRRGVYPCTCPNPDAVVNESHLATRMRVQPYSGPHRLQPSSRPTHCQLSLVCKTRLKPRARYSVCSWSPWRNLTRRGSKVRPRERSSNLNGSVGKRGEARQKYGCLQARSNAHGCALLTLRQLTPCGTNAPGVAAPMAPDPPMQDPGGQHARPLVRNSQARCIRHIMQVLGTNAPWLQARHYTCWDSRPGAM